MSKKATMATLILSPYQTARDDDTDSPDKPDDDPELLDAYSRTIAGVVERVGPAVVGIRLKMKEAAHRAGLIAGDLIIRINSVNIIGTDDIHRIPSVLPQRPTLTVTVLRRLKQIEISLVPGEA